MRPMPQLEVVEIPTEQLLEYPNNAKLHPHEQVDQIAASIEEFGFNSPILAWHNGDGEPEIVAGHGRLMAAKKLGLEKLPVVFLDHMSDEQRRAYILVDNKLTMNSDFDFEILADELAVLDSFDMGDFGFEIPDVGISEGEAEIIEDDVPNDAPAICKEGDIWVLGEHRLMCGSSTSEEDMQRLMGEVEADLVLTDPPYGVSYVGKTEEALTIENDSMDNERFSAFLRDAFGLAYRFMKSGAAFYVFHADSKGHIFRQSLIESGLNIRECLVWVKNSMVLGRQDYQWRHEPCLYGWKGGVAHQWYSDRRQTTVLEFDRQSANREHPTMKPVALIAYLIGNSTKEGDVVLDQFGGSGTTIIAAEQTGRRCIMMELDSHYCDVIIKRWEDLTGRKAERIDNVREG